MKISLPPADFLVDCAQGMVPAYSQDQVKLILEKSFEHAARHAEDTMWGGADIALAIRELKWEIL